MLIAAAALSALGCGGGGDRATASPTATATATATGTPAATIARPGLRLQSIGNFDSPVYVTAPPGDRRRVFVVEQGGTVRIVRGGKKVERPFLDVSGRIAAGGERGLLSLAFAPDYASSGLFYVYYTAPDGDIRIVEYRRASAERADHGSARVVLSVDHPASNHNGGLVEFGPDGLPTRAWATAAGAATSTAPAATGRTPRRCSARSCASTRSEAAAGRTACPSSNPFVGRSGVRPEIYAYGVRNPWRFSFTPNGDLVVADVGQGEVEEVTVVRRKGANLGWRVFEGRSRYASGESAPGHLPPAIQRFHSDGNCSITGGVVVRDPVLSALRGRYVFGDLCRGRIESARLNGNKPRKGQATRLQVDNLSSFGEDARRRVYATSLGGPVYRLVPR